MGIYLNPNNKNFRDSLRSEIYVDKTGLAAYTNRCLNTRDKYICVSRPRRFGKSMALEMLAAYYSRGCDSANLFAGLNIEKDKSYADYLNRFDVVYLNMQQFLIEAGLGDILKYLEQEVREELEETYGDILKGRRIGLAACLRKIYAKTGREFIVLIDEWDSIMRERQESEGTQKRYLDFLRGLLKDQPYIALAYMTGILPVKKYGSHSALNMFQEFSMTDQKALEEYTGFTEAEASGLCRQYGMDYAEAKSWYDGYRFRECGHIYNPKSIVEAMRCRHFSSYWTSTETYDALKIYMDMDFDGLRQDIVRMLGGLRVPVNTRSFQNDMKNFRVKDDILTLLIHLGYLGYDSKTEEAFIPNREVMREFETAMYAGGWAEVMRILKASEKLLEDTLNRNEKNVAAALDRAHTECASILSYNDENSLACAIGIAYYSARKDYKLVRELPSGRGFTDIVFLPLPSARKPAMVVELKYDKNAEAAIRQIKEKQYTKALEGYEGGILLVGINYDKRRKRHSCVIEKFL